MKKFILLFLCSFTIAANSQGKYDIKLNFIEGDYLMYLDNADQTVKNVTQQFNYSIIKEVINPNVDKGFSPMPLMWFDFKDTTTIRYYRSGNRFLVYEIVDKSPGRNNAFQDNEENRPVYDPKTGRIFFPENTYLEFSVKQFRDYKLSGKIDKYIPNSIYFIVFFSESRLANPNSIQI